MANLKALVCDDEAPLRDLMARRLEKLGLDVERAESGKDAVARIDAQRYDLLVTDIYMPDVTGLELLQQMKALDPHAQVVVVTASATLDNAVGALNHGAFAYLTKPFDHLTVFDNVVARAVEFRRALLDNLRMGEVQRRRGDLLEEEITGRIRQVKRAQQYMLDLLGCLPIGVAVLNAVGRVDLINNRAEEALEPVLSAGPGALRALLDQIPVQGGQRRGEVEVGQRRLELHLSDLTVAEEDKQQVLVVREPEGAGPSMGTLVEDTLLHLRTGLGWLVAREKDRAALRILRAMEGEVGSLGTILDVQLPPEERSLEPEAVDPPVEPAREEPRPAAVSLPPEAPEAVGPSNGREPHHVPLPPRTGSLKAEPLPQPGGSMMLRKGMTMVLEGRLRKRRSYSEPVSRPEDPDRMQAKIDRWAREGSAEDEPRDDSEERPAKTSTLWPPPLPSSSGKS
jgi:CheY-like chemotaxis protein